MYSPSSPALNSFEGLLVDYKSNKCLKFKYFATFLVCTVCLGLLGASLATHKWIIAKPMRTLLQRPPNQSTSSNNLRQTPNNTSVHSSSSLEETASLQLRQSLQQHLPNFQLPALFSPTDNKFQGEIHFGLFAGVKILNHGFGDRISAISGKSCVNLCC